MNTSTVALIGSALALALAATGALATAAEEPVRLETPGGIVHGTLLVPEGAGRHPVVLIIAGSGPTDRNGNSAVLPGPNNSLKQLAEGLAARNIASLRYDKRGIAASAPAAPSEADLRFETYSEDAAAWARRLRGDTRFSTVAILGHSEGSLIGMLAARQSGADGFISLSGPAQSAADLLRTQLKPQLPPALWTESERILASLQAGSTAPDVPPALQSLYRPSVQPYMISWLRYTPTREIATLAMPVLIAQGTTDIQVAPSEAQALKAAHPASTLVLIEGMNHVLKAVRGDAAQQAASYSNPALPVVPELIERVSGFVHSLEKR